MRRHQWRIGVSLLAFGFAVAALAAEPKEKKPASEQLALATEQADVTIRADAGLSNFLGDLDQHTRLGPSWGVALSAEMPDKFFGAELAYEGSRNQIESNRGLADNAAIWRNGVSGMAKLGPELGKAVRPYVGAGFGVSYLNPNDEADALYDTDFVSEVPFAAGVDLRRGALHGGVRATYRFLVGEQFAVAAGGGSQGNLLTTSINLGGTF